MSNSRKEIEEIEKYLLGKFRGEEKLLFEARMLLSRSLRKNVFYQNMAYRFIRFFYRRKLKREIESFHQNLFSDPAKAEFQQKILQHFNH